jgi:hypothetical protein
MKKTFLVSLTSVVTLASHSAVAQQDVYAPSLEGGFYAAIGTFYAVTSSDNQPYAIQSDAAKTASYNQFDYDWGFEATIGYAFEDTANSIEMFYRGFNTDSSASTAAADGFHIYPPGWDVEYVTIGASNDLSSEFNAVDLMFSQFLDIGSNMQMRFSAGVAYAEIEEENHTVFMYPESYNTVTIQDSQSEFQGFGPRLGIDSRYNFASGFGIVAGGSIAYLMGELDSHAYLSDNPNDQPATTKYYVEDNSDNHSIVNLRGNVGIDYVYFFDNDERSSLGLELGYFADYYTDATNQITVNMSQAFSGTYDTDLEAASFSGPYVNLKGVF